jgi:hypothetical protein
MSLSYGVRDTHLNGPSSMPRSELLSFSTTAVPRHVEAATALRPNFVSTVRAFEETQLPPQGTADRLLQPLQRVLHQEQSCAGVTKVRPLSPIKCRVSWASWLVRTR